MRKQIKKRKNKSYKEPIGTLMVQFLPRERFNEICHNPATARGVFFHPIKDPTIIFLIETLSIEIIVHECIHVLQYMLQVKKEPMDNEQQAYFVSNLLHAIMLQAQRENIEVKQE